MDNIKYGFCSRLLDDDGSRSVIALLKGAASENYDEEFVSVHCDRLLLTTSYCEVARRNGGWKRDG